MPDSLETMLMGLNEVEEAVEYVLALDVGLDLSTLNGTSSSSSSSSSLSIIKPRGCIDSGDGARAL